MGLIGQALGKMEVAVNEIVDSSKTNPLTGEQFKVVSARTVDMMMKLSELKPSGEPEENPGGLSRETIERRSDFGQSSPETRVDEGVPPAGPPLDDEPGPPMGPETGGASV